MTSPQKAKGNSFEREIAKDLTRRYGENFTRTIGSGAFIGGNNAIRKLSLTEAQTRAHKGDITPPDSFKLLNMECKAYKDFPFHQLFTYNCKILDEWISQAEECADILDLSVVVFKINHKGTFICVPFFQDIEVTYAMKYRNHYVFEYEQFFVENGLQFKERCSDMYTMTLTRATK